MSDQDTQTAAETETHSFEAEVSRLLHLMVHAVYSNKEIFLRELISNAADACEKLRHEALTNGDLVKDDPDFKITLSSDGEAGTLTVADNGIGMSKAELIDNLGTIARSGTRAFLDQLASGDDGSALIGQFGIGFYSAFMVADKVEVVSRRAGDAEAWRWISDGEGSYEIAPANEEDSLPRGTKIVLHLKEDEKSFADAVSIRRIVRDYSAHVPVPIRLMRIDEETSALEEEELTDGSALWTKAKSEITDEQYKEFYQYSSGQFDDPALTIHYRAEGRTEYNVLAFVPEHKPFDLFDPNRKGRIKLYVRRVFITDDAEILPAYLRFVRGIVDSEDIPLNISREMLQDNPILSAISKGVTNRILSELEKVAKKDAEKFASLWQAFGAVIKEGLYEDPERRDQLFKLVRFDTTKGESRTLADYIEGLKENQTAIYYALGDSKEAILASPQLEGYQARDVEVLLLSDAVDAFWVQTALGYEGKGFKSISQGAEDLDAIAKPAKEGNEDDKKDEEEEAKDKGAVAALVAFVKETLGEAVSDVRVSSRLATSPVCIVAPDFGPDRRFEKLMRGQQGAQPGLQPILEVNPDHGLILSLAKQLEAASDKATLADGAHLLLDQALILDGEHPANPADFAQRLSKVMLAGLNG
ncbi:molecular chaperone HtpG [Cohaesibacter sp. CAU 1516]|uniref:molecular chaperone HtpG n=1 Tax=Cohaesibacter sp. CAU 1516 TaxID=2576038 RepID=UPI0010FD2A07|nr:molecular chaperone HtpG [Cohaesibacter sp. CAU 1516]TLP46992.1 molecular chaperone HtpG [Cohaesibacter sp. CAU 1516]